MPRSSIFPVASLSSICFRCLELFQIAPAVPLGPGEKTTSTGGQLQRVAIARALVTRPAVILADEPTGNLDSERSHEIMELLVRLNNDEGITVILVTHEDEMAQYARRCVRFLDGRIQSDDAVGAENECSGIC